MIWKFIFNDKNLQNIFPASMLWKNIIFPAFPAYFLKTAVFPSFPAIPAFPAWKSGSNDVYKFDFWWNIFWAIPQDPTSPFTPLSPCNSRTKDFQTHVPKKSLIYIKKPFQWYIMISISKKFFSVDTSFGQWAQNRGSAP